MTDLVTAIEWYLERARGEVYIPQQEKEDLIQDAYVETRRRMGSHSGPMADALVAGMLFRACQTVIRRWVRQRVRAPKQSERLHMVREPKRVSESSFTFIEQLPAGLRDVAEGLSMGDTERECATRCGISQRQVQNAKRHLRKVLGG